MPDVLGNLGVRSSKLPFVRERLTCVVFVSGTKGFAEVGAVTMLRIELTCARRFGKFGCTFA